MMNTRSSLGLFLGILLASTVAYAGEYSGPTRKAFMQDCTREANEKECLCVLDQLQGKYSEKVYLAYNADMQEGNGDMEFISFMMSAATGCVLASEDVGDALAEGSGELSDDDMKLLFNAIKKDLPKKDFVKGCAPEAKVFFGEKMANSVCGCAYDRVVGDFDRFAKMVKEEGAPGASNAWGADYIIECTPEGYSPDVEKNLLKLLNENGVPKSVGQCFLKTLEKEYTLRALVAASVKNSEAFQMIIMGLAMKCMGAAY
jgi:hypothetical protein